MEDIEEMDVWCKEDTGMQKKLGRDMSGRTRHTTLERKGKLKSQQQNNIFLKKHFKCSRSLVGICREGQDTPHLK